MATRGRAFIVAMKQFADAATHFADLIPRRAKQMNWTLTIALAALLVSGTLLLRTELQARLDKKTLLAAELRKTREDAIDLLTQINREWSKKYAIPTDDPDGRKRALRTEVLQPWVAKAAALQMRIEDYERRIEELAAGSRSYVWAGSIEEERAALQTPAAAELRTKQEFATVVKAMERFDSEARVLRPLHSALLLKIPRESAEALGAGVSE